MIETPRPMAHGNDLRERMAAAMAAQRAGRLDDAQALYDSILRTAPNHFDALHNLAVLFLQRANPAAALELLRRAFSINARSPALHLNIGNALRAVGDSEGAIASYDRALALNGDFAEAYNNRATVLRDLDRNEEAIRSADRAIAIKPRYMEAHLNRGHALDTLRRTEEAVRSYCDAGLCGADPSEIRYYLAALGAAPPPPASPPTYITGLFDSYAERFDSSLGGLGYDVPRQLAAMVARIRGESTATVVDIGCGTGLSGLALRPLAGHLVGVDLSAKMLSKAAERGIYDRLVQAELGDFLRESVAVWDLIAAADVLIYVGNLTSVFEGARAALRRGGHFAFSVEGHDGEGHDGEGYVIRPTRRFAHSLGYLRSIAAAHGFAERSATALTIRSEQGRDVPGFLVMLEAC